MGGDKSLGFLSVGVGGVTIAFISGAGESGGVLRRSGVGLVGELIVILGGAVGTGGISSEGAGLFLADKLDRREDLKKFLLLFLLLEDLVDARSGL